MLLNILYELKSEKHLNSMLIYIYALAMNILNRFATVWYLVQSSLSISFSVSSVHTRISPSKLAVASRLGEQ